MRLCQKLESWPSGLRRRTANALVAKVPRRFKSYRLRVHDNDKLTQFLELDDSEQPVTWEEIQQAVDTVRKRRADERRGTANQESDSGEHPS